jgi:hypothetical protein
MNAFKAQQARWAKGLMQTAKKILPKVLNSDAPWHVKAEAFFHLTANISYPLMVLLSTMLLPVMIVRFQQGWFQMLLIDLPLFLASTCSISSFYLVAQRELRPKTWRRISICPLSWPPASAFPCATPKRFWKPSLERKRIRAHAKVQYRGPRVLSAKNPIGTKQAGCPTPKFFSDIFP